MTLNELFKNTTYDDTLFSVEAKSTIESRIFMKSVRGSEVPYITCAIRDKEIKLTPEEAVRQLYIYKLMNDYGYAASRIQLETPIHFGREVKRADIAIMDKDRPMVPYIIVELKKPKLTDGKEQLKSYCNATGAPIGVWTNGEQISCYNRKDPNFFEEISDIPKATQKLSDIINEKFTYEDLKRKDKISTQKKSLRSLIKEMEDEVLASAGVDSFEEIFKLIFTKLYDELICANDPTAYLQFRNTGDTDYELKEKIQGLFDDAKKKWEGIFTDESKILLSPSHLAVCVASLQDINNAKSSIPEKGNKRFLKVFDAMLAFCARALNAIKASCLNSEFGAEHKLLSQMPITNFLQSIEGGKEMTLADKEKAYLWFISFVYRLRNALFHEIIDPLNDEWQVIFKNSYHVLKQVVDQNIWRLKQLKLLPSASQAAAEEDYNREPPPDIDWPTDEEAKFTWFYYEMLKLNKDGARVLLKGKIDFAEHHYETECTVRWNESLSETAIKNASITSVVDSQEKELAAAI